MKRTAAELLDQIPVGLVLLDCDLSVVRANSEAARLLAGAPVGLPFAQLIATPSRDQVRSFLESAIRGDADRVSELGPLPRAAAGHVELMLHARRSTHESGSDAVLLGVVDVTALSLRGSGRPTRDDLTGLPNRRELLDQLAFQIAAGSQGCLLLLDVDGMKRINADFGHAAGDEVMRVTAGRIRYAVPDAATVARTGGDEFMVVADGLSRTEGRWLAAVIRAAVGRPVLAGEAAVAPSVSVGHVGLAGHSVDSALAAAAAAMLRAKRGLPEQRMAEAQELAAARRSALEFEVDKLRRDVTRLRGEARTDHLTGCPNRRSLFEQLDEMDRRRMRRREPLAVAFLDVDDFRTVNREHGDEHGDRVLAEVAAVLRGACRPGELLHRKGGEEFVLTLPVDAVAGRRAGERLRSAVEQAGIRRGPGPQDGIVTVSVGVAGLAADEPGSAFDALVQAGHRMYAAKASGRNRVAWDDHDDTIDARDSRAVAPAEWGLAAQSWG